MLEIKNPITEEKDIKFSEIKIQISEIKSPWKELQAYFDQFPLSFLTAITTTLVLESHFLINFSKINIPNVEQLLKDALSTAFQFPINLIDFSSQTTPEALNFALKTVCQYQNSITFFIIFNLDMAPLATQLHLLEAMTLRKITVIEENQALKLDLPPQLLFIATRRDHNSCARIVLDHFLLEYSVDDSFGTYLENFVSISKNAKLDSLSFKRIIQQLHEEYISVFVSHNIQQYMRDIIVAIRQHSLVALGPLPGATSALYDIAKVRAVLSNVSFVRPVDVDAVATDALSHRILLKSSEIPHKQPRTSINVSRSIIAHLVFNVLRPPK